MGSSPKESGSQEAHGADLAALIGATIAVLFTVTNTPGAWGPLSTIIGLLLLVVLLAFFWRRRPSAERPRSPAGQAGSRRSLLSWEKWESILIGSALAIVVAYVAAIASAQAVQNLWFSNNDASFECRSAAVEQAATAVRDLSDSSADTPVLRQLIDDTLQHGHLSGPFTVSGSTETQAVKIDFYDEYGDALGGCLAGYTLDSLWWIGVPGFLLTLAWWNWNYVKAVPRKRSIRHRLKRGM